MKEVMKKIILSILVLFSSQLMQAQNIWGIEATGGIGLAKVFNSNSSFNNNVYNFGLTVSYQRNNSPFSILTGAEVLLPKSSANVIRVPLKVNYSFGLQQRLFIGAGVHYNYTISTFTDLSESFFGLNTEVGYIFPLSKKVVFIPRLSYSYDIKTYKYLEVSNRMNYILLNLSVRVNL